MQIKAVLAVLVALAVVSDAAATIDRRSPFSRTLARRRNGGKGRDGDGRGNGSGNDDGNDSGNGTLALNQNLVQTGSQQDGNNPGADGQSASATDGSNFINFCKGKTLTNGAQVRTGSCNGIPMGNIPAADKMVASVFVNPKNGDNLPANQDFTIQVQMINFAPGTFTNATSTYYSAPQDLDGDGQIIGHTHVTVQDTGKSLNPSTPLDPQQFVFFKGINDAGNNKGLLSAAVDGGLPAGNYRVCSMSASANHQPVLMPVAQRGAQDDCVRFTAGGDNGGKNGDDGDGNNDKGQSKDGKGKDGKGQDDGDGQDDDDDGQDDKNDDDDDDGQDGKDN